MNNNTCSSLSNTNKSSGGFKNTTNTMNNNNLGNTNTNSNSNSNGFKQTNLGNSMTGTMGSSGLSYMEARRRADQLLNK